MTDNSSFSNFILDHVVSFYKKPLEQLLPPPSMDPIDPTGFIRQFRSQIARSSVENHINGTPAEDVVISNVEESSSGKFLIE